MKTATATKTKAPKTATKTAAPKTTKAVKPVAKPAGDVQVLIGKVGDAMCVAGGISRADICTAFGITDAEAKRRIWQARNEAGFTVDFHRETGKFEAKKPSK
jgi:hypothetical protein